MGTSSAWIAGSYQSDFARNYAREGLEISAGWPRTPCRPGCTGGG